MEQYIDVRDLYIGHVVIGVPDYNTFMCYK